MFWKALEILHKARGNLNQFCSCKFINFVGLACKPEFCAIAYWYLGEASKRYTSNSPAWVNDAPLYRRTQRMR